MAIVTIRTIQDSIITRIEGLTPLTRADAPWKHVNQSGSLAVAAPKKQSLVRSFQVLPGVGGDAHEGGATSFTVIEKTSPFLLILAWQIGSSLEEALLVVQEDLQQIRNTLMSDAGGKQRVTPVGNQWVVPEISNEGVITCQWAMTTQHFITSYGAV